MCVSAMIAIRMAVESRAEIAGMPHVEGVEHRFVDVNGLRMHVAEAGEGEPLVMLHGWPQHWYEWRHLIRPLAETRRVICPDLRGLGWTDAPPRRLREGEPRERRPRAARRARGRPLRAHRPRLGRLGRLPDLLPRARARQALHGARTSFRPSSRPARQPPQRVAVLVPGRDRLSLARAPRRAAARRPQPGVRLDRRRRRGSRPSATRSSRASPTRARRGQRPVLPLVPAARAAEDRRRPLPQQVAQHPRRCFSTAPATRSSPPPPSREANARPTTSPTSSFPGVGHFIADEIPDVVAERAREFVRLGLRKRRLFAAQEPAQHVQRRP